MTDIAPTVLRLDDDFADLSQMGGKGSSLARLTRLGVPVPKGFVITTRCFLEFVENGNISESSKAEIEALYDQLGLALVAVRSSALAEDSKEHSFAGQLETKLNVPKNKLLDAIVDCYKAYHSERYTAYSKTAGITNNPIAIVIQDMVQSDAAGVLFTQNPVTMRRDEIVIESSYGLGESIVQGLVEPDRFYVNRDSQDILRKEMGAKQSYIGLGDEQAQHAGEYSIGDNIIKELIGYALKIEDGYGCSVDIEWATYKNMVLVLQARPISTIGTDAEPVISMQRKQIDKLPILSGVPSSKGVYTGVVRVVRELADMDKVQDGEILVSETTTPDYTLVFGKIGAIITDTGGITSHAAIVSRELGKPAVVGAKNATSMLKDGMLVTVNATLGEVYEGKVDFIDVGTPDIIDSIEDHFLRSGDDITDFINFGLISMPQQTEVWPVIASKMMPFIDMDQAVDMLEKLKDLDRKGVSDEDLCSLFENPVKIRAFLFGIGILGLKTAHKIIPEKVSIDDQVYLVKRLLSIAKLLSHNDDRYIYGRTMYLDRDAVNQIIIDVRDEPLNDSIKTNDLLMTSFYMNWSFMWDFFAYGTFFLHGPYDVDIAGEDLKLVIRDFNFNGIADIWPIAETIGVETMRFVQFFETDNLWTSIGSRLRGNTSPTVIKRSYIFVDGIKISDSEIPDLIDKFKGVTIKQVNAVKKLDRYELILGGAKNSYHAHRKFYTYFDPKWFPEKTFNNTFDMLKDKFGEDSTESATRDEETRKKMWDPRNDYLDFMD